VTAALPLPRAIWGWTFEEFLGPASLVGAAFAIDGHAGEYDLYFDAPYDLAAAWTSSDGLYGVHLVADEDWEPPTAVLIENPTGTTVGFYAGGELWIDEEHRGRGLSTPLIVCLVARLGRAAYDNATGIGFSAAGHAAHAAAHASVVRRAVEAGLRVPSRVRDAAFAEAVTGPRL
jgi:GNAT superfamily N-acetyltransferase